MDNQQVIPGAQSILVAGSGKRISTRDLDNYIDKMRGTIDDVLDKIEGNSTIEAKKNTIVNLSCVIGFVKSIEQLNKRSQGIGKIIAERGKVKNDKGALCEDIKCKIVYRKEEKDDDTKYPLTQSCSLPTYNDRAAAIKWNNFDELFDNYGRKDIDG